MDEINANNQKVFQQRLPMMGLGKHRIKLDYSRTSCHTTKNPSDSLSAQLKTREYRCMFLNTWSIVKVIIPVYQFALNPILGLFQQLDNIHKTHPINISDQNEKNFKILLLLERRKTTPVLRLGKAHLYTLYMLT